ncbi:MAG TPA: hypothetical protein VFI04_07820 [Gaiellaceae bacterium]|nr:hypothetical protein [Gaiellaceae bacterium]
MRARLAALALLAILAAGCGSAGGSSGSTGGGAGLVPGGALAYLTVNTDLGSGQLESAQSVLDKFPIKGKVLDQLRSSLRKQGVDLAALESSIGPELDVAVLKVNGRTTAVGLTQPKDEQKFEAQLAKGSPPPVHTQIDGWTVFSDKQAALDAIRNRKANLSDDARYQAAQKTLPAAGDAIATAYISPAGAQTATGTLGRASGSFGSFGALGGEAQWAAAALTSQEGAFKLDVHSKTKVGSTATSGAGLADEIPSGSIVALSVTGGGRAIPANVRGQLGSLSQQLGIDVQALVDAVSGPVIAYVRPGLPLPEVTIAAKPEHPENAVKAIGDLLAKFGQGAARPVPTQVDGGTLNKVDLGSFAVYYGVADGKLVVTDSANALAELKGSVGHLSGDSVFKEAKDASGMGDGGQGFLFVDLKDALPAIEGFAQLANQTIPPNAEQNLKPLRSLLVFGSRDGDLQSFVAYLKTS